MLNREPLEFKKTGKTAPKPTGGSKPKLDRNELEKYVLNNPDKTLTEISKALGASRSSIYYNLKKIGFKYKKRAQIRGSQKRKKARILEKNRRKIH